MSADDPPSAPAAIRLRVTAGLGHFPPFCPSCFPLTVDATSTVSDLKYRIERATSIPACEQRLVFQSKLMNDDTMAIGPTTRDERGYVVSFGVGLADRDEIQLERVEREEGDSPTSPVRQFVYSPNKMDDIPGAAGAGARGRGRGRDVNKPGKNPHILCLFSSSTPLNFRWQFTAWMAAQERDGKPETMSAEALPSRAPSNGRGGGEQQISADRSGLAPGRMQGLERGRGVSNKPGGCCATLIRVIFSNQTHPLWLYANDFLSLDDCPRARGYRSCPDHVSRDD